MHRPRISNTDNVFCELKVRVFWDFSAVGFGKILLIWEENTPCSIGVEDRDGGHRSPETPISFHRSTRRHTPKHNTSNRSYGTIYNGQCT
jgi:hypothetical protein